MNKEINLAWMYPDILNLHGERGNAKCFKYVANLLGITLNIDRIDNIEEQIDFEKYDILLFNCGEMKVVKTMLEFLNPQIDKLKNYIANEKYILLSGTTSSLFGNKITLLDGTNFEGLKILNADFKERNMVIGDDLYFTLDDGTEILGSQIQMVDVMVNDETPLGTIKYGYGNIGNSFEGIRKENIIYTNCLGPAFVKNPWFAEKILRDICSKKEIEIKDEIKPNYEIETKSLESCKEFINKKMQAK